MLNILSHPRSVLARASLRTLALTLSVTIVLQPIVWNARAMAQGIVAAPNAGGRTPTVGVTANGVPQIDIARPSAAGVSHNQYDRFNVEQRGAILNNSDRVGPSQLGGMVMGNPNLRGGAPARIIVNEVTGSQRSQLRGRTEVRGAAADVVIANPNGITCDGCGFINAPRGTLTTGVPQFNADGSLRGFAVDRGDILVGAGGLDGMAQDAFDLIGRSVRIEGRINANDLGITAGRNDFDYATRNATARAADGSASPEYGIDSTALGGMNAGRITLRSTERGVGVRLQGDMASRAGDLRITSDGRLQLGNATTRGRIAINTNRNRIDLNGAVRATDAVDVQGGDITLARGASLVAGGDITVGGRILQIDGLLASGIDDAGTPNGNGVIRIAASGAVALSAEGRIQSGLHSDVRAAQLNVAAGGRIDSGGDLSILAAVRNAGDLTAIGALLVSGAEIGNSGTIAANNTVALTADGTLVNLGTVQAGVSLNIAAATLNNSGRLLAAGSVTVQANTLDNTASGWIVSNGGVTLRVSETLSTAGLVQAGSTLTVETRRLANSGRLLAAEALGVRSTTLDNGADGMIVSNGALMLTIAEALDNAGSIQAEGTLTIDTRRAANSGDILTTRDLAVQAVTIANAADGTVSAGGGVTLTATDALGNAGSVQAGATIAATVRTLDNSGGIRANGTIALTAVETLANSGTVMSGVELVLKAVQLANSGSLSALDTVRLLADGVRNSGTVAANNVVQVIATTFGNLAAGSVRSGGLLTVEAATLTNAGRMQSLDALALTARDALTNATGATIEAQGQAALQTVSFSNHGAMTLGSTWQLTVGGAFTQDSTGSLDLAGAGTIRAASVDLNGVLVTGGDLGIVTPVFGNGGQLIVNGSLVVSGLTSFGNRANALILATNDLVVEATGSIRNDEGAAMLAGRDMRLSGPVVDGVAGYAAEVINHGGAIETNSGDIAIYARTVTNEAAGGDRTPVTGTIYSEDVRAQAGLRYDPNTPYNVSCRNNTDGHNCDPEYWSYGYHPLNPITGADPGWWYGVSYYNRDKHLDGGMPARPANDPRNPGFFRSYVVQTSSGTPGVVASLSAARNLVIDTGATGTLTNDRSTIAAGRDMTLSGGTLNNLGTESTYQWYLERHTGSLTARCFSVGGTACAQLGARGFLVRDDPGHEGEIVLYAHTGRMTDNGYGSHSGQIVDRVLAAQWAGPGQRATIVAGGNVSAQFAQQITNASEIVMNAAVPQGTRIGEFAHSRTVNGPAQFDLLGNFSYGGPAVQAVGAISGAALQDSLRQSLSGFGAMFIAAPADSRTLYETRFRYTDLGAFYGSDYFLKLLGLNPTGLQSFLGDAYFDTRLVSAAVRNATGQRWLDDSVASDAEQMRALLDNGATVARDLHLAFGVALTAAQIAALDRNIVWYVSREVDGRQVLMPQLYLSPGAARSQQPEGAVIAGRNVDLQSTSIVNASGAIVARDDLRVVAVDSIYNIGGRIQAGGDLGIAAINGDIISMANVQRIGWQEAIAPLPPVSADQRAISGNISRPAPTPRNYASVDVLMGRGAISAGGTLSMVAGRDVSLSGTDVQGGRGVSIAAGRDVLLGADTLENHQARRSDGSHWQLDGVRQIGTVVTSGGGVSISAGRDMTAVGARIEAAGSVSIDAGRHVNLLAADEMRQESASGTTRGGTEWTRDSYTQTSRGTAINAGGAVSVTGAGDVTLQGASVTAQQGIGLHAGGQLALRGVTERDMLSETSSNASAWWVSSENRGHDTTTVRLTHLNGGVGGVNLSAVAGIVADYRVAAQQGGMAAANGVLGRALNRPDGVRTTIAALGQEPGLEWMAQIANDPTVDWHALQETHKQWNDSHDMMGPAAMAVLAAIIAVCTAGAGLGVATGALGAALAGSGTAGAAAISAGLFAGANSLFLITTASVINNKGDIGAVFREVHSMETVRSIAISMATAALTAGAAHAAGVDLSFSEMRTTGNDIAAGVPVFKDSNPFFIGLTGSTTADAAIGTATRYAINYAGGVVVNTTIGGESFSTAIRTGWTGAAASFAGEVGATWVGDIGNATTGQSVVRIALHGALGCGIGAIRGDCAAGAVGAVAAELAGELDIYKPGQPNSPYASNTSTALAQLIGTTAAALAGRDANVGGMAGENAVRNNILANHQSVTDPRFAKALREQTQCMMQGTCQNSYGHLVANAGALTDEKIQAMCGGNAECVSNRTLERMRYEETAAAILPRIENQQLALRDGLDSAAQAAGISATPTELDAAIRTFQSGVTSENYNPLHDLIAGTPILLAAVGGLMPDDSDGGGSSSGRRPGRGAENAANAQRLNNQLTAQQIARGHAFDKHVLDQGEFTGLGIRTEKQFADHIESVMQNPTASRSLSNGRTAYWDDATGTVVIKNPRATDMGTAFRPVNGRTYFDNLQ